MAKRVALVDADSIAWAAAAAVEQVFRFPDCPPVAVETGTFADVERKIVEDMKDLRAKVKNADIIVALSCPSALCFRRDILPDYKANRAGAHRPRLLDPAKDFMRKNWESFDRPRLEADDIVGILATHPSLVEGRKVICSIDKDLRQVPGWLFNWQKDEGPKRIAEEDGDYWHLYMTLVGDTTDGFAGCPGIGPKKATAALVEGEGTMWERVVHVFKTKGLSAEEALVQARVARVLRATDYDLKRKEPILWTP